MTVIGGLTIASLFVASLQPIPFTVLSICLRRFNFSLIPEFVKVLWVIGFVFGISNGVLGFMIAFPHLFNSYWGIFVMWLVSSLNGVEHWLFALEYYKSSIDITKKLSLKPPVDRPPTYISFLFILVSVIYSLLQAGCCVGQRFLD